MLKELLRDLKEYTEMLKDDIEIINQGKSNLTTDQVVENIRNDLRELIAHYGEIELDLRKK